MKSQFVSIVLTAGLAMLGCLTLRAQNSQEIANIPFAFHANQTAFAAGEYRLQKLNTNGMFRLSSTGDGHSIFVNAPPIVEAKNYVEGHLTFACYQGDCVLSQIWLAGSKIGYARLDSAIDHDRQRKIGVASMINVRLNAH
jgi:hypothetical protein